MIAERRGGHILFAASFAGLVPNRELGPYCVTKFGVVALAECLQRICAPKALAFPSCAPCA
jgi:short-subunit dehydrogenase